MTPLQQAFAQIDRVMQVDRHRLRSRLRAAEQATARGQRDERRLAELVEAIEESARRRRERAEKLPQLAFDPDLPITARREEIVAAIREHQVLVVCGETGSGKSTQLPKLCLEAGRGVAGLIGHTQPRRIAARSIAARLAEELGSYVGGHVGFKIRFHDGTSPAAYVKLMTDGILLAETQSDRFLDQYDTLILDEAHERSLNIDFLLGYLKQVLPKRRDLRLIITSATIDAARFAEHFADAAGPAPVIEVSGRTYPVEVRYRPVWGTRSASAHRLAERVGHISDRLAERVGHISDRLAERVGHAEELDEQENLLAAIDEVAREGPGDILVFLPTERDIRDVAKALRRVGQAPRLPGKKADRLPAPRFQVLPLYARLPTHEQQRVFQPHGARRVVLATNVAESSLTVPGIRYVVDTGTARVSRYSPRSKVQRLPIEPVAQASADQRAGRCGRLGPGVCIRLYAEDDYLARDRYATPEIRRTNLAGVILQMLALKLGDVAEFPFLDPPKPEAIRDGFATLFELGAIDGERQLTDIGRRLARLPVDPCVGRMILAGAAEGCLAEVLIIAAALEIQDPRDRPADKQQAADEQHARFADPQSDFVSLLKLWEFFHKLKAELSRSKLEKACRQSFLSLLRIREWQDVHRQLREFAIEGKLPLQSKREDYDAIHRALLTGLLSSVALRTEQNAYTGAGGGQFFLWPGSGAFAARPQWVMAAEWVETSRKYLRTVARIDPKWIEPLAGHVLKRHYRDPHWSRKSGAVLAHEKVTLFGLTVSDGRRVPYHNVDPAAARVLFIEHALVQGDLAHVPGPPPPKFFQHNQSLRKEICELADKARRRDFVLGDHDVFAWYDERLPAGIADARTLAAWCGGKKGSGSGGKGSAFRVQDDRAEGLDKGSGDPSRLFMALEDLLPADTGRPQAADYPDKLALPSIELPLKYRFQPGEANDGVTLTAPREGLAQLHDDRIDWLVPGLLHEKVLALLRSLPKEVRRKLMPLPDTAREIAGKLAFGQGALTAAVASEAARLTGERISTGMFGQRELPDYLRLNVRVLDDAGQVVAQGRDIAELRRQCQATGPQQVEIADARWHRDGITSWNFGELPPRVEVPRGSLTLTAFPALIDRGDSAALRLLDTAEAAEAATRGGARRLFVVAERRLLKGQIDCLPNFGRLELHWAGVRKGSGFRVQEGRAEPRDIEHRALKEELIDMLADRAFLADRPLPRREEEFAALRRVGSDRAAEALRDVSRLIEPLLTQFHQVQVRLEASRAANMAAAVEDIRRQLDELLVPGFFTATPWEWLTQFPRYLQAIVLRLEKLKTGGANRDQQGLASIAPHLAGWRARHGEPSVSPSARGELDAFRWMLEEFRVSLFAQELGTKVKVSPQRLAKQWELVR